MPLCDRREHVGFARPGATASTNARRGGKGGTSCRGSAAGACRARPEGARGREPRPLHKSEGAEPQGQYHSCKRVGEKAAKKLLGLRPAHQLKAQITTSIPNRAPQQTPNYHARRARGMGLHFSARQTSEARHTPARSAGCRAQRGGLRSALAFELHILRFAFVFVSSFALFVLVFVLCLVLVCAVLVCEIVGCLQKLDRYFLAKKPLF